MDPIITTPISESTLVLQTILTVMLQTTAPQPGMELLPDQQQAYQEEQQACSFSRQIDAKRVAAQRHDELPVSKQPSTPR
jgi:hypothetical protein